MPERANRVLDRRPEPRPTWRAVAVPAEHGGWGLTLEPVLLGLLVAPSAAGLLIGAAAFGAFLARTPLKVVLVDARRGRRLHRSVLAARIALVEVVAAVALACGAVALAGPRWLVPAVVAAPLVAVELHFDMRSRSRRLVPELCGAVGIAGAAAAIVVAGGGGGRLALGAWLVLTARSAGSIPFVRGELARFRGHARPSTGVVAAQVASLAVGALAVAVDGGLALGYVAIVGTAGAQLVWLRRPPVPVVALGVRQVVVGLVVVMATAVGVSLP